MAKKQSADTETKPADSPSEPAADGKTGGKSEAKAPKSEKNKLSNVRICLTGFSVPSPVRCH